MDQGQRDVALRATEVPMLEPEIVRQILGFGRDELGIQSHLTCPAYVGPSEA